MVKKKSICSKTEIRGIREKPKLGKNEENVILEVK